MARLDISDMKKIYKDRNSIHGVAAATYTTFVDYYGVKYFQIDMYGSDSRKVKGNVSQTIQIDKDNAVKLIELLKTEFNL